MSWTILRPSGVAANTLRWAAMIRARRAVASLRDRGLVVTLAAKGTYIAKPE